MSIVNHVTNHHLCKTHFALIIGGNSLYGMDSL